MSKKGKIRIAVSSVIFLILALFSVGYTIEYYILNIEQIMADVNNMDKIIIDGADFTTLFKLIGIGNNLFIVLLVMGTYNAVILIAGITLLLPYRLIALNPECEVSKKEYRMISGVFMLASLAAVLICLIITRFTCLLQIISFNGLWMIPALILVIHPTKKLLKASEYI